MFINRTGAPDKRDAMKKSVRQLRLLPVLPCSVSRQFRYDRVDYLLLLFVFGVRLLRDRVDNFAVPYL